MREENAARHIVNKDPLSRSRLLFIKILALYPIIKIKFQEILSVGMLVEERERASSFTLSTP